jgi:hypothetical protein
MADTEKPLTGDGSNNVTESQKDTVPAYTKRDSFGRKIVRFVLVCLYIGFLTAAVLGLLAAAEYYAYVELKDSSAGKAYETAGKDMEASRRSSQQVAPQFGYEPTPGFATIRNTKLGNAYEFINEQSFKDFEPVPREKPENEYRVFVTGGSVVFGRGPVPPSDAITDYYEVTYRWTIPHIMEKLLNADPRVREKIGGKKARVINAGVAGYVIQNNLMRYLAKLRLYDPDLVVSLDGANEVHTVARPLKDWNYFTEGPYYEVVGEIMDMSREGLLNYIALWLKRNTYLFSYIAAKEGEGPGIIMENRGFAALPQDPTPEMLAQQDKNIEQVADTLAIYDQTLETDGVPHVLALQPMFHNCKKERTPIEQRIEEMTGMEKIGFFDAVDTYEKLVGRCKERVAEEGSEVLDLTGIFDDVHAWVFTDWCHLTNGANYILAKALVNEIKTRVLGLPLLPDDKIKEPKDSYFTDYAKEAIVTVDGKQAESGVRILKGYPGPELFEVKKTDGKQVPPVIMDIGKVVPVSRLRIVWGDAASVPQSWQLELSMDGETWESWLKIEKTQPDGFDQWPGYEYYAAEETDARYARYKPLGEATSEPIKLRQLSLYR